MKILISENEIIFQDGDTFIGNIHWQQLNSNTISIDHTHISEAYSGQGLAQQLILSLIEYAQNNHFKITASCSFARHFFEKNKNQYQDIWLDNL